MPDLCRSCKAPVIWAITEAGKWTPLNAEPDSRGEWRIFGDTPRAVHAPPERRAELAETGQLFTPHWATCPHADQHRRPR
jgi:hypothetical protein